MATIRKESGTDIEHIRALQYKAFKNHPQHEPGAEPTEHLIVDALREAGALSLSLVAEDRGRIAGHIAFSPLPVGGKDVSWFGLGPVGVLPQKQNRGLGSQLVREGIKRLRAMGARGIVLVGDPAFYGRFGFRNEPSLTLNGVPPQFVLALHLPPTPAFEGDIPRGEIQFHPAFFVKP